MAVELAPELLEILACPNCHGALAVDHERGPQLPSEFHRPEPNRDDELKSPLPPEWSDATKQLRDVARQIEGIFGDR